MDDIYKQLCNDILINGNKRNTRSGNVISKFGISFSINVTNSFPLLTTKKMYLKAIIGELLWFIGAKTDNKLLKDQNIHIWDGNSSREFLDKNNLSNYEEDDCGPIYGFQWRHWNAEYIDCHSDYSNKGIDQLQNIIYLINNDPMSRRIIMSAWNVEQLDKMCLVPCHVMYQFYVSGENNEKLSVQLYQRSADVFLGLPFNIASTALLLYVISHKTNKIPHEVSICIGDAHIYEDHLSQINEQLTRTSYNSPTMNITYKDNLENYKIDDFQLNNYNYHPILKGKMAV